MKAIYFPKMRSFFSEEKNLWQAEFLNEQGVIMTPATGTTRMEAIDALITTFVSVRCNEPVAQRTVAKRDDEEHVVIEVAGRRPQKGEANKGKKWYHHPKTGEFKRITEEEIATFAKKGWLPGRWVGGKKAPKK